MILKTIIAGPLRQQILYSNIRVSEDDSLETRRQKNAIRRQTNYWFRTTHHALAALILTNFDSSALWCTLTFTDERLPDERAKVARRFSYMVSLLKRNGNTIRYIKSMEHRHGAGRWHIHCIISGCTTEEVQQAWIYGGAKCERLDPNRVVPHKKANGQLSAGLAKYLCKEAPDQVSQRLFQTSTRSARLARPEVVRQIVPDDYQIKPPIGCRVIEGIHLAENSYGSSYGMEWMLPLEKGDIGV